MPEGKPYRPVPLKRFERDLDALPPLPLLPPAGTFDIVRVAPGDSLRAIALHRLGNADECDRIFQMNQDVLEDADHIYPGMPLRVPKEGAR